MTIFNKLIRKISKIHSKTCTIWLLWNMLEKNGFLYETGWKNSIKKRMPVNKEGEEIPWFTYSFLDFFIPRLKKEFEIFEYGAGNSTIFYSQNVKAVYSVENDRKYYNLIESKIKDKKNSIIICEEDLEKYPNTIHKFNKTFDIIVIDGRERVKCIYESVEKLKENGVVIFDNSLRSRYADGITYLFKNGFKCIHFKGLNPLGINNTVTSVFYRDNNVLEI